MLCQFHLGPFQLLILVRVEGIAASDILHSHFHCLLWESQGIPRLAERSL